MKKTDTQIQTDVQDELQWDASIRDAEIGVAVKDRVVTLSGYVDTYVEKFAAINAAERVSGVAAVADDLQVKLPHALVRPDTEIAHAAVNALRWDIQVPHDKIRVEVSDGWVTLDGNVEWQFQKSAAERAVRYLKGVKGVSNLIILKPKGASPKIVSEKIKHALRRNAEIDADQITVEALDGKVTLKGKVRSWTERADAERAAWSAPGVMQIDDRLVVGV